MSRDATLIALKLKGFVRAEALGDAADLLIAEGLVAESKMGLRLSPSGREAASAVWAGEIAAANAVALEVIYGDFNAINSSFKALVTDWQIRAGEPNDHTDSVYDDIIVSRLGDVHLKLAPILYAAMLQVPRLAHYTPAFENALGKLKSGETRWMAAPIIDSYHTLWFELHEELIQLTGRTRAAEAAAGHAA
jgi:hypothetical protein